VLINTNGTMLSAAQIARLGGYGGRVRLSVSLDGPPEMHDRVRGDGRFAEADRAVAALLAAGVPTTLMAVVTPAVLAVLPEFLRERMAAHPGLDGITLFPVGVGPSGSQKPGTALASLDADQVRLLAIHTALAFHAGVPVTVGAFPMINPLLKMLGYPAQRMYQCTAGRGRVCVHADQGVSTCHPVKDPVYGRWSSGLFDRLGHTPAHAAMRDRDFDGCRTCDHREDCSHCRAFVTANGAALLGNDRVCLDVVPGRRGAAIEESARAAAAVIAPASLVRRPARDGVGLVERFAGVLASGRFEELEAIVADDCDDRNPLPLQPAGRDGVCYKLAFWRASAPEALTRVVEVLATDDGATARWQTEVRPGESLGTYVGRFAVSGGRIRAFEVTHVA
jgi:MoaA/NifB/PqqE/SkfB family radical SAM enzyme